MQLQGDCSCFSFRVGKKRSKGASPAPFSTDSRMIIVGYCENAVIILRKAVYTVLNPLEGFVFAQNGTEFNAAARCKRLAGEGSSQRPEHPAILHAEFADSCENSSMNAVYCPIRNAFQNRQDFREGFLGGFRCGLHFLVAIQFYVIIRQGINEIHLFQNIGEQFGSWL